MTQHKKSHHIKWDDMTWHHMTWHDTSQLTTLPHLTPTHNQPNYFITSQPTTWHHVAQHRTLHHHHRHTTETQPATTKMPEGWCTQKTRFGPIALVGRLAHILWANSFFGSVYSFFSNETSAAGPPGNCIVERHKKNTKNVSPWNLIADSIE